MAKRDGSQHEKKPKNGEGRGNKRRQSEPGRDLGGAKHEKRVGHNFPIEDFKKIFNSGSNCIIASDYNAAHAEVIADSLQELFEPNHVIGRELFDQHIHDEVTDFINTPHVQEIEPTTPTEILSYVQRLKPRKSPGLDQISNRMIKNLPLKFLLFITLLINQLFKNKYFPNSWKTAVVIPILKPEKDSALPSKYRPISLLSCLSKVYEFVLLQRLNQHSADSNFIIPQQCGFRPKCSTVHQLLRVTELIHSGFAKHEATESIKRSSRLGLLQGSLSSPLLFTLYVNDIPQTDLSHLAIFADDTAIITQNKRFSVVISNLQHYISLLELWLTDWKVKVNASKSACLMFTRRPRLPVGLTPVQIFPTRLLVSEPEFEQGYVVLKIRDHNGKSLILRDNSSIIGKHC
ncbi:RNA-directed DNA polymerase from mobile element jockey [Trichonephila clavipes]|nr:RNA-directed DNA polymerase from mobile element jockey [Trichonephila clavipes]